jgi:hypothetical protein
VRRRTHWLLGLVLTLALASFLVAACGGEEKNPEAKLRAALDQIEADMEEVTAQAMASGTTADVKAAFSVKIAPHWQAVADACDGVEGADKVKAEELWDAARTAIESVPDGADLATLCAAVIEPVGAAQTYLVELRQLVGPSVTD